MTAHPLFPATAWATAAAALLACSAAAQAGTVTFDDPAQISIDNTTGVATYAEAGFTISGQAADFLLLDDGLGDGFLVGGLVGAQPISLRQAGGGAFALLALDVGYFDLGEPAGFLDIIGLLNGQTVALRTVAVGPETTLAFNANWAAVTEVRFSAGSGFRLDNISAVPEPGSLALALAGLAALAGWSVRRRS